MSEVFKKLKSQPNVELKLLVSGAHLSPAHGLTIENIRNDHLDILAEVETLISGDTNSSRIKTASCLLSASIDVVKKYKPDLILIAGDREDVLVGAMIGAFLKIPTVHFFGGDHAQDSHVDNAVRHATSKLASAHFVSTTQHRDRLVSIGESIHRIFVIGSVALEKLLNEPKIALKTLLDSIESKPHAYSAPRAILIFHPIDSERNVACNYIINATTALIERGLHVFIGSPNTDPGNVRIREAIKEISKMDEVTYYGDLPRSFFVNLFRNASLIIGNSSAGILEAGTLKIPAINIGNRQRGRLCGKNVIFTDGSMDQIRSAVDMALLPSFQEVLKSSENPYGNGRSVSLAVNLLMKLPFQDFLNKPEDPLYAS